ncbi:LysR substrate-binding domain-containing protein [Aliisedimentitalea scapharcae]|uniref:LysR substrate-binding domain-containing protein n=1 Tax=Aliisedimentitalea scapharcae TaxID=1524259 RepID=A0ABZ2XX09_9RHOB
MKLPPLNALRAFESAARTGSFSAAGAELGVTSAAVSMQVRNLEDWLGLKLFARRANQIRLTDAGREYYMNAASALTDIAGFTQALTEGEARQPLVIAATPALAQFWLPDRLQVFRRMRPDVPVHILTETDLVDLDPAGVDVLLTYGGEHPDYRIRTLFSDRLIPVAATPDVDLANAPLIDVDWGMSVRSVPRWAQFVTTHGLNRTDPIALVAPSVPVAVSMVRAGMGVALLPQTVLAQQIKSKSVFPVTDLSLPMPRPYVMVMANYKTRSRRLQDLAGALGVL